MAGRGPRARGGGDRVRARSEGTAGRDAWREPERSLVRICDLAGRPRGAGFAADELGTVITSHEAVDGLARIVLHAPGERTCVVAADAVTALPEADLALVRTEGLGLKPLPVTVRDAVPVGTYVRLAAGGWRQARVLDASSVTYAATDRFHVVDAAMELAIGTDGADALRLGGGAAGGPVLDASSGAVLAVLATALHAPHRAAGFAVPLRDVAAADPHGPLAALLARNAATVPGYGHDLNLAGALHLTATCLGSDGPRTPHPDPVERPDTAGEFTAFTHGPARVLGLVGDPGTGRTTELAALAARRARGPEPTPTLWLRGADLRDADTSVADAVARALERAGRILSASEDVRTADGGLGDISAGRVARLVRDAGRPLLLLLDGPEEMPPVLAHRLAEWSAGTAGWLRDTGTRLVVACRPEYWEQAGAHFPAGVLHSAGEGAAGEGAAGDGFGGPLPGLGGPLSGFGGSGPGFGEALPGCVRLGDLPEREARRARARYGIPDGALAEADARHPLALRLLSEVRAAVPGVPAGRPGREEVFSAYLDLVSLRVAVRLAAANGLRGSGVRRLAAKVSGQVHEAARRCLGPGQGELDRASFEEVFPWGSLPGKGTDGCTGWASAVLAEGLLVPAGAGYRFAHEEVADWLQGTHLDVGGALASLVHRHAEDAAGAAGGALSVRSLPVPRHRIGPVLQALLLLERQRGPGELAVQLGELAGSLEVLDRCAPEVRGEGRVADARWWAQHLLGEALLRVGDARPYLGVLQSLAAQRQFAPDFWMSLPLADPDKYDLLRAVVPHDGPPGTPGRVLDTVAERLAADPGGVQRHLTRWFTDESPLRATPHATVASAAQALLHTHRHRAIDDLTEALVDCAHARGDELLGALAEDEPSAVCRAVDRWAHDDRPGRRVAAAAYGLRAAPHVTSDADRTLLRYAAYALLSRPGDDTLHGTALALLVRDPQTRARHLPAALKRFTAGDPRLPASALAAALTTHPETVLTAFRARLRAPDSDACEVLRSLADVTAPALVRRVALLIQEHAEQSPQTAAAAAAYVDLRLEQGPGVRGALIPLVTELLRSRSQDVRIALAPVLAAPGTEASGPLRADLLDLLLGQEREPAVVEAVLHAVCGRADASAAAVDTERDRRLVHRIGLLLGRTPEGATRFDRALVDQARRAPDFAARLARWIAASPGEWDALVGPSARRTVEGVADAVPA
ncbi:trypsin-like peptidase domain-containing protein [Streptomyces sp. NPDC059063]|uniref:trypsin-like peptidase domain-containing protein n=1 Tax=unclassified Streptomyces TaxID=2593676 RepID=UPI00369713D2